MTLCDERDERGFPCRCAVEAGHETPHVCLCGGGWVTRPDGTKVIYEWSGGPDPIRPGESVISRAVMYARRVPIAYRAP